MKRIVRKVVLTAVCLASIAGLSTSAMAESWYGCAGGYVCIENEEGGRIEWKAYDYGVHKIYNQYNWKWVVNNQWAAWAKLCTGSNGNGTCSWLAPGDADWFWMDPYNSVVLLE